VPSHVDVALAGGTHGAHEAPQVATAVLLTQLPPQRWKPVLHEKPHAVPSQIDAPFAGAVQGEQELPQVRTSVSSTHAPEQR
jgi:hypothetical protein